MNEKYIKIKDLPHHVSTRHPQMTMYQRAAQFAPFSALTGHDAALRKTAKLVEVRYNSASSQPPCRIC